MGFVVLQNMSSNKMMLLCYYGGAIVNGMNNNITYNGGSIVLLNASLDMSLAELKNVICGRTRWNYNDVEVDIFWRMLARERPVHYYVAIPIFCDMSLKTVAGLSVQYGLRLIELYLNSRPKRVHSSSTMKYTQIPTYTQMVTQASQSIGSSRTISGVVNYLKLWKEKFQVCMVVHMSISIISCWFV